MKHKQKLSIYKLVSAGRTRGIQLATFLAEEKREAEYEAVMAKNAALSEEGRRLWDSLHRTWTGDYEDLKAKIDVVNAHIESDLEAIKQKLEVAERVVGALGRLDELIDLARKAI